MQIQTPTLELNQVEVTALAHHKPQVCAVDDHLLHHEQSIRAVSGHLLYCSPPVCAVGDHVLLESNKEQVKEQPEPAHQELVVKVVKKWDSPKQSILVNSPERDQCAMLMEEALRRTANNLTDQDLSKDPRFLELSLEDPELVLFWTCSSHGIKVSSAQRFKVASPSSKASTAWIRPSRGVTQWARQSSEFAPEMKGTECGVCEWRSRSRPGPAPRSIRATGDRLRFILK